MLLRTAKACRLAAGLTLVFAALFALPSAAGAFGVSNFALTPDNLQASGHPNVKVAFTRTGTEDEDLRDIQLDLPPGLLANPEAANPKCTDAQFAADTCPVTNLVGSLSYKFTVNGLFDVTVPGSIYMLEPGATDTATVGFVLRPPTYCFFFICAVPQKIFQKTSFKLRSFSDNGMTVSNQNAQRTISAAIPLVFISPTVTNQVTIKSVQWNFQSRAGTGNTGRYFTINTASCTPAKSLLTLTSYQSVAATAESTFTPTGCASVPFDPSINVAPSNTGGGETSTVLFELNVPSADAPIQNAYPKSLNMAFPDGSAPDFVELGKIAQKPICPEANLQANTCPAESILGLASATSGFLPPALNGGVWVTGPVSTSIPAAAVLIGPRGSQIIVRFTLGIRTGPSGNLEVYATFANGPQLPYSKFALGIIPLYQNPQRCGAATSTATIEGWNGATVTRTSTYNVTNCKAPETTITSAPPPVLTVQTATVGFASSVPGSTFKCKIDQAPEFSCTSPYTMTNLAFGPHTFSVYAINGTTPDATPATASFSVQQPSNPLSASFTLNTLQAAAHPTLSTQIDIGGNDQVRTAQLALPDGFQASLNAAPLCPLANATAGTCPAASKIGTAQVTATTSTGAVSGSGDAFLTAAPTANDAGGIAVKIPLPSGNFISLGGQSTIKNTNAQLLQLRDIPNTVGGTPITITQFKMALTGGTRLFTNSSSCTTSSAFALSVTSWSGAPSSPVSVPYQATGCASVPFTPTVGVAYNPQPAASAAIGTTVDIDLPIDNSSLKQLKVIQPAAFGPNNASFGVAADRCTAGSIVDVDPSAAESLQFNYSAASCPARAKVGQMTINTPLLLTPLVGDVYQVNRSPIPYFGVIFQGYPGITLSLAGSNKVEAQPDGLQHVTTDFASLPDTPLTHVKFVQDGGDRTTPTGVIPTKMLVAAEPDDPACTPTITGSWLAASFSGKTVTGTFNQPLGGCTP